MNHPPWIALTFSCTLAACGMFSRSADTLPKRDSGQALFRDLERLVTLSETEGWGIERYEIESALPAALQSYCRSSAGQREKLSKWLDARMFALGGPVEEAYKARGKNLDAVEDLLTLHRIRRLFREAGANADADCPFYVEGREDFAGRQIIDDRFLLSVGGGGKGIVVRQNRETDFHFGGAGRLLVGRAFGSHATYFLGAEMGGSASFPKQQDGERGNLRLAIDVALPLVYRHRLVNSYWEVEAGYLAHFIEGEERRRDGFRVGIAVGGSASRKRWLFPGAAFGVAYERVWDSSELLPDKPISFLKLGFRVAFDVPL